MQYHIISADCHIDMTWMPGDLWVSHAPTKWKELVPQVRQTSEGPRWYAEGKELGVFGGLRLQDQELIQFVYEVYNTWAADFCKTNPRRFVGLACLPSHDPQAAATELRRAASLGLKGADFAVSTAVCPIWHRAWDPLWAAAQECQMPISFHTTGYSVRAPSDDDMAAEYKLQHAATRTTMFQIAAAEFLASIVFSGALERFPGFKFVLGEAGVSWIPYILDRMDEEYEDRYYQLSLSMKPSEFWRRQGYSTYQHEPSVATMMPLIGEDNIMWGSDYPHPDGIWPDSRKLIAADLGAVDERLRRKIVCETAGKLYGLL